MKKKLKSKKVRIMALFVIASLIVCGVVVYAASGFRESFGDKDKLDESTWNGVLDRLDGLGL